MKHLLILISILLLSSPVIGQSEKPQTIIVPTGSLGEMSEARIKILEKTLESKIADHFAIVPKELFEEAQEQAFQEMDSDECTEDQCILMIKEILQIENAFKMDLISEDGDTQISITWNDQDQKRVVEDYCEGCKTKELRNMIGGLVEKLIGVKDVVKEEPPKKVEPVVVEKKVTIPKVEPKVVEIPKKVQEPVVQKTEGDKTKGMFVTVGHKGTILTSSDGISWTSRESGTSEHLHGITNKNGMFVTVGGKGIILTSSDGISWTSRYGTLNGYKSSAWLFGIGHGNGLFVAVGDKGTIFTSLDGTQWTSRNLKVDMYGDSVAKTTDDFKGVTFGNRHFVTVSWERTIWTSLDGNIWTKRTLKNTNQIGPLQSSTFGGDTFVIVGFDQTILTSKDGINWTQQRSGLNHINDIIYKNGKFLTFENNGKIKSSIDTLRWESMDTGTKFHLNRGSFGKGRFVVVGENGTVLTSSDGISWTSRDSGTPNFLSGITFRGLDEKLVGGKEEGVLFERWINGEYEWSKYGNKKRNVKYEGEIKNGRPNGMGTLTYPIGGKKYVGEFKDGKYHGQGTLTNAYGRKKAGEFRENIPWNITHSDKDGNIIGKWVSGVKQ